MCLCWIPCKQSLQPQRISFLCISCKLHQPLLPWPGFRCVIICLKEYVVPLMWSFFCFYPPCGPVSHYFLDVYKSDILVSLVFQGLRGKSLALRAITAVLVFLKHSYVQTYTNARLPETIFRPFVYKRQSAQDRLSSILNTKESA